MTGRFEGTAALVTGAASGIGRAVARRLGQEGATVLAVDRDEAGLGALVDEGVGALVPHVADLADPAACRAAVEAAVAIEGRLDVVGNIAGTLLIEHTTAVREADYRRVMAVNVDACFFVAQAAIPHLVASGGTLINLASSAALMGQAYTVPYCMSKAAVVALTQSLAMELVKTGVRVNAIAPGTTDTPLVAAASMPEDLDAQLMAPYIGFRPPADPAEVAALFAHLASDDARSVHGAVVSIDNGVTAG